ncbi:MAG: asparagine synthase-related protein [Anaerolineae bacterium]
MSAIIGIFRRDGQPVPPEEIKVMLAAAPHRAVDGEAVQYLNQVALAHQHFWITPEERGERQPLVDDSGCLQITADVRLDNRRELIQALSVSGSKTISDAMLILLAYQRWGTNCVEHLLGDFAFVIWDVRQKHLFAARDPLGVRDLCYYVDRDICLLASEVNQILAHPAVPKRINERRVVQYLNVTWHGDKETFFEDVFFCPPAHCLLVTEDNVQTWRYWDVDPTQQIHYHDVQAYAEHFLTLLRQAVRDRLRTTDPVGISLSGGLDSTSVAAIAAPMLSGHLHAFSYVFDRLEALDERAYIQPLVAQYDIDAHYLNGDNCWPLSNFEHWPVHQDFIYHDCYAWLPLKVMEAASASGCRVLLSGVFGDQLFLGGRFWAADMLEQGQLKALLRTIITRWGDINIRGDLYQRGFTVLAPPSVKRLYRHLRPVKSQVINTGLHPRLHEMINPDGEETEPDWYADACYSQIARHRTLIEPRLPQGASTARQEFNVRGLERLDPFWDRRLVEFVMALPADILGLPGNPKRLLREAMRGLLPEQVRTRTAKTSFYPLFQEGLLEHERERVDALTTGSPEIVRCNYTTASWLAEEVAAGANWSQRGMYLWLFLCLELWLQHYWT